MSSLVGAFSIIIIIILVLAVSAIYLWALVSRKWQKDKVEIYKKKVARSEKKIGLRMQSCKCQGC